MEKFKITKTIRFKLANSEGSILKDEITKLNNNIESFEVKNFIAELFNLFEKLEAYLFFTEDNELQVSEHINFKKSWLRLNVKNEYYKFLESKEPNKIISIKVSDIPGLEEIIKQRFDEVRKQIKKLNECENLDLNQRARDEHISLLIKQIAGRNSIPFFLSLVEHTDKMKEEDDASMYLKNKAEVIKNTLLVAIQKYLPNQSQGLSILKASFNYYTINKTPIDFQKKKEELEKQLVIKIDNGRIHVQEHKKGKLEYVSLFDKKMNEEVVKIFKKELAKNENAILTIGHNPLSDEKTFSLRQFLKQIKAEQRKKFEEAICGPDSTYERLKQNPELFLFNNILIGEYNNYKKLTEEIQELANQKNNTQDDAKKEQLTSTIKSRKQKRGELLDFQNKDNKQAFKTYKGFIRKYTDVARIHGKTLALLKSIEKESIESALLSHWALIIENNQQHQLALIPKEKAKLCKEWLETSQTNNSEQDAIIWFESLQLRSLRKLCFGFVENRTNSFYKAISQSPELKKYTSKNGRGFIKGEYEFEGDEQKIIQFYKHVLRTKYTESVLKLPFKEMQDTIFVQDFENLDEFKIALERITYKRYVCKPVNYLEELKKFSPKIFNITSQDLEKAEEKNLKHHTILWKKFWTKENEVNHFAFRLNPEIQITYRLSKTSRMLKYGHTSSHYDPSKKNRYLHPQFTLVITISENCNSNEPEMNFKTDEELAEQITGYNQRLSTDFKFALGIDNGVAELATLGVCHPDFLKKSAQERLETFQNINDYGFKTLEIKNPSYYELYKGKDKRIIAQNPSYFLNKETYKAVFDKTEEEFKAMFANQFKEKTSLSLNLSIAKVINNQLVSNGDIYTFFNLCLKEAQRLIYEMNDHSKITSSMQVVLKTNEQLNLNEKWAFIEKNHSAKRLTSLETNEQRNKYIEFVFEGKHNNDEELKDIFKGIQIRRNYTQRAIYAINYMEEDGAISDIKIVFQLKPLFNPIMCEEEIMDKLKEFNVKQISNEELDLKLINLRKAVVSNAIGVIDFLYKAFQARYGGEGIIVKEHFKPEDVDNKVADFRGNIYRLLEMKLYQKFQNYGLVPPIKRILSLREEKIGIENIQNFGIIGFVNPQHTSNLCPVCEKNSMHHTTICPENCGFDSMDKFHSNDGIAGFNIAKRGLEKIRKNQLINKLNKTQ
ncbi:MAG: transposase [Chitinophagaceae bacterium]|nr:transposase [Chitinophagaceae bacterium]